MNQFLELCNPLPGNRYLLVTTHADEIATALAEKLLPVPGDLDIQCYPGQHQNFDHHANVKMHHISNFKAPFRGLPRSHDMVIFQDIYHLHQFPERMVKLAYTTLANTAHLIIMQRRGTMDLEAMLEMLERMEYRAGNVIDVLDGYDLVMAKKMHMWGNGL